MKTILLLGIILTFSVMSYSQESEVATNAIHNTEEASGSVDYKTRATPKVTPPLKEASGDVDVKTQETPKVTSPLKEASGGVDAKTRATPKVSVPLGEEVISSKEFVSMCWEASNQGDLAKLDEMVNKCLEIYDSKAKELQAQLTDFPERGKIESYQTLNNVATVLFIKAEALMNYGKRDQAIELFQHIIDTYPHGQAWDPRGWYWSVAEKSQASIDVMEGRFEEREPEEVTAGPKTLPKLFAPGKEKVIDYTKYGRFVDVGKQTYRYEMNDPKGLSEAVGEGIYPNTGACLKDPGLKRLKNEGRLDGDHWDFVHSDDLEAAFFKWAMAKEPLGVRLFYLAIIFEKAKMYYEAIKAYHALVVHFPKTIAWTYWQTPWYPAQAAIAKIKHIIRTHPELNLKTKWMKIEVANGFDNDVSNDIIITYPGVVAEKTWWDVVKERLHIEKII